MSHTPKYQTIFEDLRKEIWTGGFHAGDQLPSERELASKYRVTRSTARRALRDLEQVGLVYRDGARGTRVLAKEKTSAEKIITLVCTSEPISAADHFLQLASKRVEEKGWGARILRLAFTESMDLLRSLNVGNAHVLYSERLDLIPGSKLNSIVSSSNTPLLVLGNNLSDQGIPSIICDDVKGMHLALDHLTHHGHRRIALLCGREKREHAVLNTMVQQWREVLSPLSEKEIDSYLVHIEDRPFESLVMEAYQVTRDFLSTPAGKKTTALLCLKEDLTVGAIAACRDSNRPVPESISVVEYAPTPRARFAETPRTMIDVHMEEHVDHMISWLEDESTLTRGEVYEVVPSLVEGKTVSPV